MHVWFNRVRGRWRACQLAKPLGAAAMVASLVFSGCVRDRDTAEAPLPQAPGWSHFPAPALIAEETRRPGYDDFIRIINSNIPPPTRLGGPDAYRVFFGATAYYKPAVTVTQFARFSGIPLDEHKTLYAMRCMPPTGSAADPVLATWANLIIRIREDYEANTPKAGSADEAIEKIAESFDDRLSNILTEPLAHAPGVGEQFFETYAPLSISACDMQKEMSKRFGTFVSFSGLGYAAEGTASTPTWDSLLTTQSLATPDFILKNVSLLQAGCHCIEVPDTVPNRDNLKLDPDFILTHGGNGSCVEANLWAEDDPY